MFFTNDLKTVCAISGLNSNSQSFFYICSLRHVSSLLKINFLLLGLVFSYRIHAIKESKKKFICFHCI